MSVLIKGMEMPKGCYECACYKHKYDSGWYDYDVCEAAGMVFNDGYSSVTVHIDPFKERLDNCPLIELPSHGRLIDGDALRQAMYHEAFETDSPMQKWDSGCWIRYKMFERTEETAPTVIPAEEAQE